LTWKISVVGLVRLFVVALGAVKVGIFDVGHVTLVAFLAPLQNFYVIQLSQVLVSKLLSFLKYFTSLVISRVGKNNGPYFISFLLSHYLASINAQKGASWDVVQGSEAPASLFSLEELKVERLKLKLPK